MIKRIKLTHLEDDKTVLKNPHKGWYWHYDNVIKYSICRDKINENETYKDFPGLNHLCLRIGWSDVAIAPNVFDWSQIDQIMERWGKLGYTFSFRVCSNFDLFLKELARKFDGNPLVEYIELGSDGCGGEGDTFYGNKKSFSLDVLKQHCILYAKYFMNTKIIVSHDFITQLYGRPKEEVDELRDFCYSLGFGMRDDSVLVGSWDSKDGHYVGHTEFYDLFYDNAPSNIDLVHYNREQARAGLRAIEAARRYRITNMGFYGSLQNWFDENYYVTQYLANRLGYWYFVSEVSHNDIAVAGAPSMLELVWENRGFARCYHRFNMQIKYTALDTGEEFIYDQPDFDNRILKENEKCAVRYFSNLDRAMKSGAYSIGIRLHESGTPIMLGLKEQCRDNDGFYHISEITVKGEIKR